jgi:hypothetical protein
MNETWLGTIPLFGTILVAIGCWFYMLGGRDGKWKRRFIGSLICSSAIWLEALLLGVFHWIQLLVYPLLAICFSLGYGSDIPLIKVVKRTIVVVTSLLTGVLFCLTVGHTAWLILPIQAVVAAVTIWLGVKNPVPAAAEEYFICLLLTICNLLYPFAAVMLN